MYVLSTLNNAHHAFFYFTSIYTYLHCMLHYCLVVLHALLVHISTVL